MFMAVVKTNRLMTFSQLHRGAPFMAKITIYSKSDGKEDPKEHFFFKLNSHKAVTLDKRITVHMFGDQWVTLCQLQKKEPKQAV